MCGKTRNIDLGSCVGLAMQCKLCAVAMIQRSFGVLRVLISSCERDEPGNHRLRCSKTALVDMLCKPPSCFMLTTRTTLINCGPAVVVLQANLVLAGAEGRDAGRPAVALVPVEHAGEGEKAVAGIRVSEVADELIQRVLQGLHAHRRREGFA